MSISKSFRALQKNFGKKIYALRKEKNLTQEQMEEYELSLRQFQRIEIGETTNITLSNIFKISKALGIRPCELLDI